MFKSRINDLLAILHGKAETLKTANGSRLKLTESEVKQIKRLIYLVLFVGRATFTYVILP